MLKIGVLGVGHLGKIHLKCIQMASDHYELAGFYDVDPAEAERVSREFNIPAFDTAEALIEAVDVVDIVTPTPTHHGLAREAILKKKHLFIEKPLTQTVEQGAELVRLSKEQGVKVQVGHVERFNPALLALGDMGLRPMFIEAHRLAQFNPRGTDVSVVLDLMIHDIDIVLSLVNSKLSFLSASGVSVVSDTPDIANARLEFENGCVANLTASRISLKQMRKVRLFQPEAYISLDFLSKEAQVVRMLPAQTEEAPPPEGNTLELDTPKGKRLIHMSMPEIEPVNAIKMELESLAESIQKGERPRVDVEDGFEALEVAHRIAHDIDSRIRTLAEKAEVNTDSMG
jgi:hypothetical protein